VEKILINSVEEFVEFFNNGVDIWVEDLELTEVDDEDFELLSTCYGKSQEDSIEDITDIVEEALATSRKVFICVEIF